MSAEKVNQLFWLNYGQAIKDKAGANFGSTGVFFLASETQKGPLAGNDVLDVYTNRGIYDVGNNLLATDNLFYTPSSLHGYVEALSTFLWWVDLGGKSNVNLDSAERQALLDLDASQKWQLTEMRKAAAQFKEEKELGLVPTGDFYDWVQNGNATAYSAAVKDVKDKGQALAMIQGQKAGPMSPARDADLSKLTKALDQSKDYPGFNFASAMGNPPNPAELIRKQKSGEKVPDPPTSRIPVYNAPLYKKAVQDAMQYAIDSKHEPKNSVGIEIDLGKSTSDFHFGHTQGGASVDVSYGGWFSFSANASHEEESQTLDTHDEGSEVSVKLLYDTIEKVPISTGDWQIDVSKYKLRDDAPKDTRTLAKVNEMVIVTYLGYEITVGTKTASSLDTKFKQTTSAGGSVRVFGIPIGLGGSGSSTEEHNTHVASWDNAKKTFRVLPAPDNGFATIIGVIGEKFTLAT
ncbi:hypothetical protein EJ05DRAFT_482408 [Pseudovirgaria hyperparasitica]|uniref:Uncharacterized protein n=1 Tax=Pseudovirgaria hyperparasitica TaxID=470096 RepID=A0A6A6WIL8_9PEZI|nr:uncharacterized protein EJ05DRAFT_482408 [Pseudovirgaria hyperparasitica]KAF2761537.1 hypothetical protein EJ05DRAFT_482408 [Pseudovirgaria hyperparasitica]